MDEAKRDFEGIKKRLEEYKSNNKKIKLMFNYPHATHAVVKRGKVREVFNDSFDFEEIWDGLSTYSYRFLVEIMEVKE